MPTNSSLDARDVLARRKLFSLRPQPLEQWIWKQGIAPSAERVFWLHWQAGMRNRDWCSEIALSRVAAQCSLDVSTVTRAYQALARIGLIRRQDPGRDPARPFERAVCVTEVRVPRALLQELGRFPDRAIPRPAAEPPEQEGRPEQEGSPAQTGGQAPLADPFRGLPARERQRALNGLLTQLSPQERRQYQEALRLHQPHIAFDADTNLDGAGRAVLLQFLQIAASRPQSTMTDPVPARRPPAPVSRQLNHLELALLRRQLTAVANNERAPELLREIVWAVEHGALARFTTVHGTRIALKKLREGAWTRPNRMPPNWLRQLARSDLCRTA
jgi:DNA-binding MarR family transcriptional regulator